MLCSAFNNNEYQWTEWVTLKFGYLLIVILNAYAVVFVTQTENFVVTMSVKLRFSRQYVLYVPHFVDINCMHGSAYYKAELQWLKPWLDHSRFNVNLPSLNPHSPPHWWTESCWEDLQHCVEWVMVRSQYSGHLNTSYGQNSNQCFLYATLGYFVRSLAVVVNLGTLGKKCLHSTNKLRRD